MNNLVKTLIGKNNYLFLNNDANQEIKNHQTNTNNLYNNILNQYIVNKKIMVVIFPDKSLIYNKFLPDNFNCIYRPSFNSFKQILGNIVHDPYSYLVNINDCYYKTDTHINLKGSYEVYKNCLKYFSNLYNININIEDIKIIQKYCEKGLNDLNLGLGDLTWKINYQDLILNNIEDNYYYSDNIELIYCKYIIKKNNNYNMKFFDYNLVNKTEDLVDKLLVWDIISNYIIITNNENALNNIEILIFYDSFLLSTLTLYMKTFKKIIFIKKPYSVSYVNMFKIDYIIEFKVERFLNNFI